EARAAGRRTIQTYSTDRPEADAFLTAMGLVRGRADVLRRQHVRDIDWDRLESQRVAAEPHAAGYELLRWPGRTPEEMLVEAGRMFESINDAPVGDLDIEDDVFSPERIRAGETA